jgi:hypothetical protein
LPIVKIDRKGRKMTNKKPVLIKKEKIKLTDNKLSEATTEDIKESSWKTERKVMASKNVVTIIEMGD